tara:strand:+ start:1174 stop:1605 length:432 start_codon:yes stop_codon:yes gene_type:complete
MIIYSNITPDTNLTGSVLLRDIFKKHWVNAVKLYEQHGYDTLSGRNVTVCATNNNFQFNTNTIGSLLVDYNVIYLATMGIVELNVRAPILVINSFDNFVCEYSVFFKLMSAWREIDCTEDNEAVLNENSTRLLEYQNIMVRQL